MRASTKERGMLLTIAIVFLSVIIFGGYFLFGPRKAGSMIATNVRIIDKNNKDMVDMMVKDRAIYAFKVEENGAYFLEIYRPINFSEEFDKGKYDINKKDYDTLEISKFYWFDIKFKKADVFESGIVRKVYTEDPMRR